MRLHEIDRKIVTNDSFGKVLSVAKNHFEHRQFIGKKTAGTPMIEFIKAVLICSIFCGYFVQLKFHQLA